MATILRSHSKTILPGKNKNSHLLHVYIYTTDVFHAECICITRNETCITNDVCNCKLTWQLRPDKDQGISNKDSHVKNLL
ncbi:hypothetical protein Mapa_009876 [Marchantia paleacea]|nr:hypothetical protein Mapa_009876 [Marchantia paleacea]